MKTLLLCVVVLGACVIATADEQQAAPLVARVKFVELDGHGRQLSKIDFSATLQGTGPVVASVTDSSNHRIQMQVEKHGEQTFQFKLRIAEIDAAGKEKVIAEPVLTVVQEHSGNMLMTGIPTESGQTHLGVIVTSSEAKPGKTTGVDPLSDVGRFVEGESDEPVRPLPEAKKQ